jgi:catechol 2,3-dioxygenase-like lactoylglutathione lyase family enzyme
MTAPLHHVALCPRDFDASLRFYRDGIGLHVLMDHEFTGNWPALFGARSDRLRSVFLGDPASPDAGIVELVAFADGVEVAHPPPPRPSTGFFLLSFFVDVDATLTRLAALGSAAPTRITVSDVEMATVRDPDGVLVELVHTPAA